MTGSRRIVIVRHGERMDFTFGMDWFEKCFDSEGKYTKLNLNMPDSIEKKKGMPSSYSGDSPLTQVGHFQGFLVGKGLVQEKILRPGFSTIVSPAIRSIQTCAELLKGMQQVEKEANSPSDSIDSSSVMMKVEPALFEWTGFYAEKTPTWLSLEELEEAGYNVDKNYSPFQSREQIEDNEPCETYYNRSYEYLRHLINEGVEGDKERDILLVCHGITLDAATRQLFGFQARSKQEMFDVIHSKNIPYAAIGILEEIEGNPGQWTFVPPGPITMKHNENNDFEANVQFPNA